MKSKTGDRYMRVYENEENVRVDDAKSAKSVKKEKKQGETIGTGVSYDEYYYAVDFYNIFLRGNHGSSEDCVITL